MKRRATLWCLISLAAGCTTYEPLEVVAPFEPGTWTGTFSNKENFGPDGSVSQSGTVTFVFSASNYTYEAEVTALTNRTKEVYWGAGTKERIAHDAPARIGTEVMIRLPEGTRSP